MGTDILPGKVLTDGTLVHDADFNTMVGDATILPTAISSKTLKPDMSLGDEFLINDAGNLKKVTGQQIVSVTQLPAGCMMDYAGATEPLGWAFCYGQELSRTTYAALFTAIGTAYGAGDGSTTFNVPDCRGRVTAGDDNMGGTAASRLTTGGGGVNGAVLGSVGGAQSHTLVAAETPVNIPAHTHTVTDHLHPVTGVDHTHYMQNHAHHMNLAAIGNSWNLGFGGNNASNGRPLVDGGGNYTGGSNVANTAAADRSLATSTGAADRALFANSAGAYSTGGSAHFNVQPTIIMNKIIKT